MKKILVFLLAITMAFAFVACIGDTEPVDDANNNEQQEQNTQAPDASEPEETADDNQSSDDEEGFSMPTLNSYEEFPSSDYWTALGLPADFTIEISEMEYSSKNSIYPLNAKDGNMFYCVVSDNKAAYTALADSLWNAGINGTYIEGTEINQATERGEVDVYNIDVHVYSAYWLLNGEVMHIEIRANDGSDKISVLVRYSPEI